MGQKAAREKLVAEEFAALLEAKKLRVKQRRYYEARLNGTVTPFLVPLVPPHVI